MQTFWKQRDRMEGTGCAKSPVIQADLRGQVTETMDALGQKEVYTYDKKGQLLSKLDKEGYLTKYAYTKQGDLSGIQYADRKRSKTVL